MDHSERIILTPFNLFEWKDVIEILLREKGLYRVTMETEAEPNVAKEKIKWHNRRDEAYGILCLSISRDPLFHLDGLTSPNEVWENLEDIFGNKYEMRGHHIENELITLNPSSFESLQLYFTKFKALVLQLKQCGIEKKEEQLVLTILSRIGSNYSVFVSTFHATKLIARA